MTAKIYSIVPALDYINYKTNEDDEGFLAIHPELVKILPKLNQLREKIINEEVARALKQDEEEFKAFKLRRARKRLKEIKRRHIVIKI